MYSHWNQKNTALPVFNRYGITAQHCRQYGSIDEHQRIVKLEAGILVLQSEQNKTSTNTRNQKACVLALANFALTQWSNDYMAELMFPSTLRKSLAAGAARIDTNADLACKLSPTFALETSVLGKHADKLILIIKSALSPAPRDVTDQSKSNINVETRVARGARRKRERGSYKEQEKRVWGQVNLREKRSLRKATKVINQSQRDKEIDRKVHEVHEVWII